MMERFWGFVTWDLLCRAASPSLLFEDAEGQTGGVSSPTPPSSCGVFAALATLIPTAHSAALPL